MLMYPSNKEIADVLTRIADLLEAWVVVYFEHQGLEEQCTVVTEQWAP